MDVGLVAFSLAVLLWLYFYYKHRTASRVRALPPGPPPLPIFGNLRDLTSKELWLRATEWVEVYGEVTYLHVLGQGLVFLSGDALFELLDKRGSIYSDKPKLTMAGELCGCDDMVAFTGYGEQSRRQRRLMHRAFGVYNIRKFHPLLELETKAFLERLLSSPSDFRGHIRRYAGGLTLLVVYGYKVTSNEDEFLTLAEECVSLLANRVASGGGIWPVDIFPSLKHIPSWFPGAGFKRNAIEWKAKIEEFVEKPYAFLKASMKQGTTVSSFCSTLLEEEILAKTLDEKTEYDIKWTANSMYAASIDTTITAVSHFLLAMLSNPHILQKAQAEIDSVVGRGRLPAFADRSQLRYVEALVSEVLRWSAPIPLSLPHRLMEDDFYRGMFIPKGSMIFGNIWSMVRDPKIYPNPDVFDPERFLEDVDLGTRRMREPRNYVFGFGRRRCPGANLVESSIWLLIVSMLATVDIEKARDEHGSVIEVEPVFDNSIFRTPNPFPCAIRPRSESAMKVVLGAGIDSC